MSQNDVGISDNKIKRKKMENDVIKLIKTNKLRVNYSKLLRSLFVVVCFTKHIALCIRIQPYNISFDYGYLSLGIDFSYRLINIDHRGINIILRLLFFEIEIECTDNRHLEDYETRSKRNY